MGEFNSDDHYIYYCGQESLKRNGVAIIVNKRVQNALLGCHLKNDRMISVSFQSKSFSITVIQVYAPTSNAEEAEVDWFSEDVQDLLELTLPKRCHVRYRGLGCQSRKSRDTWSNRQTWPWSTEWSRSKANRVLPKNTLLIANTLFQQHKRRLYTWTSPDGQHQNQIVYILCSQRWRSSIQPTKTRPGADCGSDHELLIAKFRLKLKKVWKTTRPFRYDLNQTPYDYTVEVTNRYKGLDLIDRVPEEPWTEVHDIVPKAVIKAIFKKKKCKKAKWLSDEALRIAEKRGEVKVKWEKERYTHLNAEFRRMARRDKKAFLSDQCKEREENNRMVKTRDLFK